MRRFLAWFLAALFVLAILAGMALYIGWQKGQSDQRRELGIDPRPAAVYERGETGAWREVR